MVWPTLGSRTAKEHNRTEQIELPSDIVQLIEKNDD